MAMKDYMGLMGVSVPPGRLDGINIERFVIPQGDMVGWVLHGARAPEPGRYTKLMEGETVWMSDTTAERTDHLPMVQRMDDRRVKRVLINGLGLGMVVQAALSFPHIQRVDVVEKDQRVIDLVAPHYYREGDGRFFVWPSSAYTKQWYNYEEWDLVWHDIWPTISDSNVPGMQFLWNKYHRLCRWQSAWCMADALEMLKYRDGLLERIRAENNGVLPPELAEKVARWQLEDAPQ